MLGKKLHPKLFLINCRLWINIFTLTLWSTQQQSYTMQQWHVSHGPWFPIFSGFFQKFKRGRQSSKLCTVGIQIFSQKNGNYRSTFVTWYSLRGTIGFNGTITGAYVTWSLSIKCRQNSRALNAKSDRVRDKVPHKIKESSRKLAERLSVKDYYFFSWSSLLFDSENPTDRRISFDSIIWAQFVPV